LEEVCQPWRKGRATAAETRIDINTGLAGSGAPMVLQLNDLRAVYADEDEWGEPVS